MITSVHLADVGPTAALRQLRKKPDPRLIPGLRHAEIATAAPLSASLLPTPQPGRIGLVAFWEDEGSLDDFVTGHPLAATFAAGLEVRLAPLRMAGTWPGVPTDIPTSRSVEHDGPTVVLTLGRLRYRQALRFLKASAKAEGAVVGAEGLRWATGLARPPFVSTCSFWESTKALSVYAYGHGEPAHADAIDAGEVKPFHHESAFIRFHPYAARGSLGGRNPVAELALADG